MSERRVIKLDGVQSFIVGTIGQPGEREFFLQAKYNSTINSFGIDKSQVVALADRLSILINELKNKDFRFENVIPVPLQLPLINEFQVGVMGIAWLNQTEQVEIELQAFAEEVFDLVPIEMEGPEIAKIMMSADIANHFLSLARKVVAAGRQPCPFCGLPINLDGHLCPRANGYRR